MSNSEAIWVVFLVCLACLALAGFLSWMLMRYVRNHNSSVLTLMGEIQKEKADLLNRMMSQDLPTYATTSALTTSLGTFSDPIPRDDVSEAERMVAANGFGQTLFDEDSGFHSDLEELGLYVDRNGG